MSILLCGLRELLQIILYNVHDNLLLLYHLKLTIIKKKKKKK
jgi:hypothetical protein